MNFETGTIKKVIYDKKSDTTTEEYEVHPYREEGGNVYAYLDLLTQVEDKLRTVAAGSKVGDTVIAKSYPQAAEYADQVLELIRKFTPIALNDGDLFFGGNTAVFDFYFQRFPGGRLAPSRNVRLSQNDKSEWEIEVEKRVPTQSLKYTVKINLATGELSLVYNDFYRKKFQIYRTSALTRWRGPAV